MAAKMGELVFTYTVYLLPILTTRVSMDEAKLVHRSLRRGAGLLKYAQEEWVNKLIESPAPMSDSDPRVHTAYLNQATAEAQEGQFDGNVL